MEEGVDGNLAGWKMEGLRESILHGQEVKERLGRARLEQVLRVKEALICAGEVLPAEEK